MRQTLALLAAAVILFWAAKPVDAAPGVTGIGDRLSLSITNKYGDVLANPTVTQILGDGLVLQQGAMAMKVKYEDLPPGVRQKYQPLAAGVIQKEEKQGAATAAYVAYTRQLQAEQALHSAVREAKENELAQARIPSPSEPTNEYVIIPIPNQSWKITFLNLGFSNWEKKQDVSNRYVVHGLPGPNGFDLVIFVSAPANNFAGNDAAYNFYWSNMAHDSLIDDQSVKVERKDKFIKVSYTAQGQPNVNYCFACQGSWVDLHLAKPSYEPGDEKLFAAFDDSLSYGD